MEIEVLHLSLGKNPEKIVKNSPIFQWKYSSWRKKILLGKKCVEQIGNKKIFKFLKFDNQNAVKKKQRKQRKEKKKERK